MTELMVAARMHRIGGKLQLDHVRIPTVGPDDVLVDVRASGICHSDINYLRGFVPVGKLPITLGHEIAGIVARTGRKVKGVKVGNRVCVHYIVHCGNCVFCRTNRENYCVEYRMMGKDVDGGFAQFVRVPARSVVKLPEAIQFEQGAILGCAVPTAFHALRRGRTQVGDTVLIFGIGGLGAHAVQLAAKIFKSRNIIAVDLLDAKLKLARMLGANEVVNATHQDPIEAVRQITNGRFADVVIDFVGHNSTIEKAIQCVGKGGRMVLVGIGAKLIQLSPYRTLIGKEMEILGVNDHLKTELVQLVKLVKNRRIDLSKSVTHKLPLEDINRGIGILEENTDNPIRVVVMGELAEADFRLS
jgi:propanol-preferring alcohol dehydrogenase